MDLKFSTITIKLPIHNDIQNWKHSPLFFPLVISERFRNPMSKTLAAELEVLANQLKWG
jgi:hypothetical protein